MLYLAGTCLPTLLPDKYTAMVRWPAAKPCMSHSYSYSQSCQSKQQHLKAFVRENQHKIYLQYHSPSKACFKGPCCGIHHKDNKGHVGRHPAVVFKRFAPRIGSGLQRAWEFFTISIFQPATEI